MKYKVNKNEWVRFDIVLLAVSLMLIVVYGFNLKIEILWGVIYFFIPMMIVISVVNLLLGSIIIIFSKTETNSIFLATKSALFGITNITLVVAGNFWQTISLDVVIALIILGPISFYLSHKLKSIIFIILVSVYVSPSYIASFLGIGLIESDIWRVYISISVFMFSIPYNQSRSGSE